MARQYLDTRHYNMPFKNYSVQGFGATDAAGNPIVDVSTVGLPDLGIPLPQIPGLTPPAGGGPADPGRPAWTPRAPSRDAFTPVTKADLATSVETTKKSILMHGAAFLGLAIVADFILRR